MMSSLAESIAIPVQPVPVPLMCPSSYNSSHAHFEVHNNIIITHMGVYFTLLSKTTLLIILSKTNYSVLAKIHSV